MPHLRAPFTDIQVAALNRWQRLGHVHPFTCGNDSQHRVLRATPAGWICEDCDYRQDWAHAFMLAPTRSPFAEETEVGAAQFVDRTDFSPGELKPCEVVVSGPDKDGDICLLAGAETYLPRVTAARLANEILLRLKMSEELP